MISQKIHFLEDEDLIDLYRNGHQLAYNQLLERYRNKINNLCNKFFAIGLSRQDLFQEGAIGLYIAIKKYDKAKKVPFNFYAILHIKSSMINAVKYASRKNWGRKQSIPSKRQSNRTISH